MLCYSYSLDEVVVRYLCLLEDGGLRAPLVYGTPGRSDWQNIHDH